MMNLFDMQRFATQKGTSGNNTLVVKKSGNVVYGYAGNDSITNVFDKVTISAGVGNDYVWNRGSNVQIFGEAGKDFIINSGDSVKVAGGADNDSIFSYGRYATVTGDAGNDYIENQDDYSNVFGGAGKDTIITSGYGVTVSGGKGNDFISFDKDMYSYNVFQYASGDGDDTISGFDPDNTFYITKGSYETVKSGKNLILKIGSGSVTFLDAIDTPIKVRLSGDTIETIGGGEDGSSGKYISNSADDTIVGGTNKGDTINNTGNYVTLNGGAGNDSINANNGLNSYVSGGKGNDTILGHCDFSTISGGAGSDIVSLPTNARYLNSGNGKNNIIQYASGDGNDTIFGFDSNDTLYIAKGNYSTVKTDSDVIVKVGKGSITLKDVVESDEKVNIKNSAGKVSTYNDWSVKSGVYRNTANNVEITCYENGGRLLNDFGDHVTLTGNAGADSIINNNGNSVLITGGAGNDYVTNEGGSDITITGGKGNDTIKMEYYYSSSNLLTYASGDGNDLVYGFGAGDSLKITSGTYKTSVSDTNVIVTVGSGKITLRGAASKPVTIIDAKGKSSTKIYGNSTSALFAEGNFATADNLDSIVKNNLSAVDYKIETQNFENLTQENLITFAEK